MASPMKNSDNIVILSGARTPIGGFQGALQNLSAPELAGACIRACLEQTEIDKDKIEAVFMGCVLPAGQGQAPARQAGFSAGLEAHSGAVTLNKMCGSGLYAVMMAHDLIAAGTHKIITAGGMESMSQAPYLLKGARAGYKMGHGQVYDHMFIDGLEDVYEPGRLMGVFAEDCASHYNFSRKDQDNFAIRSLERAQKAIKENIFTSEIVPITIPQKNASELVENDEQPLKANIEKIPQLKPAFAKDGTVTAANASSISDGAAALIISSSSFARENEIPVKARIIAHAVHSQTPKWFTTAPVGAIRKVLDKAGWAVESVDLFEINEAFACVPMAAMKELDIPADKVNVHGGACALGHPIGASGARILTTLLAALEKYDLEKGIASLCLGGGEAVAMAVQRSR